MERGNLIAVLVVLIVGGALAAVRLGADAEPIAPASEAAAVSPAPDRAATSDTAAPTTTAPPVDEPDRLGPARNLIGIDGWLQTEATGFDDFDGQVRIVQFWTFGCYNCKNTIPHLQAIYDRYRPDGLEIIGVHAPEFDYEKDPEAVAAAAVDHGVVWPIALDTDKVNFRAWQPGRRFWPRTFVIDQDGQVRFDHIGEGRYDELEATVAYLVANGA